MITFHGGCAGCTQQKLHGTEFCAGCQFFDSDWSKPDLNNRPPTEADIERERIKQNLGVDQASLPQEPILIMDEPGNTFDILIREKVKEIILQREEILRAFIAKYGFEPDRAIQIEQRMPDGTTHWFIRRMGDEEMAARSAMGAQL